MRIFYACIVNAHAVLIIIYIKQQPNDLGEQEVTKFLTHLAVNRELTLLPDAVRARAPTRVPTVLSHKEALSIIGLMKPKYKLMFSLLYGSGLRKAELLKLRVKDIDFKAKTVFVFRGKGGKDRTTMLPSKNLNGNTYSHRQPVVNTRMMGISVDITCIVQH